MTAPDTAHPRPWPSHRDNGDPYGIWSDGEHIWTADANDRKVYARNLTSMRNRSQEVNLGSGYSNLTGIAIDTNNNLTEHEDRYLWVSSSGRRWALDRSNTRLNGTGPGSTGATINLHSDNADPSGLWSDGTTIWTMDRTDLKLYAYNVPNQVRDPAKDWDLASDNANPGGLWSDGRYAWVSDTTKKRLYAYLLENGDRRQFMDLDLHPNNRDPKGITGRDRFIWVADDGRPEDIRLQHAQPPPVFSARTPGHHRTHHGHPARRNYPKRARQ